MAQAESSDTGQPDADGPSLAEDLRCLVADGRRFAEAELAYQKSRAAYAAQEMRGISILGVLALFLLFFALMALVFGLVLALVPLLGTWAATASVSGGLTLAALLCALMAARRARRMGRALSDAGRPI
jgi:Flp pilus assembly protein TadB